MTPTICLSKIMQIGHDPGRSKSYIFEQQVVRTQHLQWNCYRSGKLPSQQMKILLKSTFRKPLRPLKLTEYPLSRHQFPLQNAFALTVHKTQELTLPHVTLTIDQNMFAPGQ